jgi:hypothetical protein
MMHDPREIDPRFPDRPQHEDWYLLSEVIQENDAKAEQASADVFGIAGVDQASAIYAIKQRYLRMTAVDRDPAVVGMGLWLDGFAAGVAFNQRRSSGTEAGTAGEGSSS